MDLESVTSLVLLRDTMYSRIAVNEAKVAHLYLL